MGDLATEILHLMATRTCCPDHARLVLTAAITTIELIAAVTKTQTFGSEAGFSASIH
jgi:hypothetical protein